MKESDKKIIQHLRANARNSLTTISRETGVPTSTVFTKIKEFEDYIITGYVALMDFSILGYHNRHKTAIKLGQGQQQEFEEYAKEHKNVNSLYEIDGGYHYMIETVHKNIKEYLNFLGELKNKFAIEEEKQYQIIREIKREAFVIPE